VAPLLQLLHQHQQQEKQRQEAQQHLRQHVQIFTQHMINLLGSSSSSSSCHLLKLWHYSCSLSTWQPTGVLQH
jgi:hypothetical protein